jgi:seryl-tRNA synthetase
LVLELGLWLGGYMGQVERRNKKRDEFVQMLEWNKNLAQEILDKKNAKEEEKKKAEEEAKVLRDEVEARERGLRDSEKEEKDAAERFSEIEKLEDLLAKRNDIVVKTPPGETPPTNEIDIQIGRIEAN